MSRIIITTDGSCDNKHPKRPMGWCAILQMENDSGKIIAEKEFVDGGYGGSNNVAEIRALMLGIESINGTGHNILVRTDSEYLIGIFSGNKIKKNVDLINEMFEMTGNHSLTFEHVKGHADDELNNRCDELAKNMFKTMRSLIDEEVEWDYAPRNITVTIIDMKEYEFNHVLKHFPVCKPLSNMNESVLVTKADLENESSNGGIALGDTSLITTLMGIIGSDADAVLITKAEDDSQ